LYFTVHENDDEAYGIWKDKIGVSTDRILRMGDKTNFWMMGDVGPCGPTSEIHYDWGPEACTCGEPDCGVLLDNGCDRWLEVWNLVFMQFDQAADGTRTPLPKPGVDTGMGLERLASVVQQTPVNYDNDLFTPAMDRVQALLGDTAEQRAEKYVGYRVIADHGRAATFIIGDGVRPGAAGAGYVLRMIIRRAARFGRSIGFNQPFLAEVAKVYIEQMGDAYPELRQRQDHILHTLTQEEERFARTLDNALIRLYEIVQALREKDETVIPGEEAFTLYATYGLPLEITRDVIKDWNVTVDEQGYEAARAAHALASGSGAFKGYEQGTGVYGQLLASLVAAGLEDGVEYNPYEDYQMESEIVGIIRGGEMVQEAKAGDTVELVTAVTPFYVESGGEISDTGRIYNDAFTFRVTDMKKPLNGLVVHVGQVESGTVKVGDYVQLEVDNGRRSDIRRNHTATHILHRELRKHLGNHVLQQGSLVAPDRLRFDFSHHEVVDRETLSKIEADINQAILANYPVYVEFMGQKEAVAAGAMALFGEKYGDIVRTIQIGRNGGRYSFELCGGLHVSETNDIGLFRFTSEGAVAAGVRRVEAVTGRGAHQLIAERLDVLDRLAHKLNTPIHELESRLDALQNDNRTLQKQMEQLQQKLAAVQFERVMLQGQEVAGVRVVTAVAEGVDSEGLRILADRFRDSNQTAVGVIGTINNGKPLIVAVVTKDLIARGLKAGDIVREVAKVVGGGGGGRPDMAQAGGKDPEKLPDALAIVPRLVEQALG
jgi:alanyl-tRNA synthetase